jgi:hypothetical protein
LFQYIKLNRDGSTRIENLPKECIIRHIIHHPENPHNSYTEHELATAIHDMREYIERLP